MKHLLIVVTSLLILQGCSKPIDEDSLIERGGKKHQQDSPKPYTGETFALYESGQMKSEGSWINGVKNGSWASWNEKGQKILEAEYSNGAYDGDIKMWDKDGQQQLEAEVSKGKIIGSATIWTLDKEKISADFRNNIVDGGLKSWYANGQKHVEIDNIRYSRNFPISHFIQDNLFLFLFLSVGDIPNLSMFPKEREYQIDKMFYSWYENGRQKHEIKFIDGKLVDYKYWLRDGGKAEMTDSDGNKYKTVQIGNQVWMAENLRVTHYRDSTPILKLESKSDWSSSNGSYCYYYDNDKRNADTYGALYNWYAVNTVRNLAPEGWHVPTDDEWKELEMYLGMSSQEAESEGSRGTNKGNKLGGNVDLWNDGTMENSTEFGISGFDALPGGCRTFLGGTASELGNKAYFWSTTDAGGLWAWSRQLYYDNSAIDRGRRLKNLWISVRLLRDPPTDHW